MKSKILIENLLNEIGEANVKPYFYKLISKRKDKISYGFKTNLGTEYIVDFELEELVVPTAEMTFYIKKQSQEKNYEEISNKGELFKVMSTIANITKTFIQQNKNIESIFIKGAKDKKLSNQRTKLYQNYIQKNLPSNCDYKVIGDSILISC